MITEEQAKQLKVGDIVHYLHSNRKGCSELKVTKPFVRYGGEFSTFWTIGLDEGLGKKYGISDTADEEWHLPSECPRVAKEK